MIETRRLRLREPDEKDVPGFVEALNDWKVAQWLVRPPYPYRESDAHDFFRWARSSDENGFNAKFVIADRATDELHGVVTIEPFKGRAELGYWLKSSSFGRGYMTGAVTALLRYARPALPSVVIYATIDPENRRSERVLVTSGFHVAGRYDMRTKRKRGTSEVLLFELGP